MAANGTNGAADHDPSTSAEQVRTDIVTLTRFLTEEQAKHKEATGDFT
jgi:fructose-1,6-bisphosphatase I